MKSLIQLTILGLIALFITFIFSIPDEGGQEVVVVQDVKVISEYKEELEEDIDTKERVQAVEEAIPAGRQETKIIAEIPDVIPVPDVVPVVPQPVVVQEEPKVSFSEINTNTREALVNIFCTTKSGGSFKPITGSGIIIDDRGIVLTNAHVAQYFLLKDYLTENFMQCTIRTGSPARSKYKATPIFISPSWVKENANSIIQQTPKGTGEADYALILITGRTDPVKVLPETFSFIPPEYNSGKIEVGGGVLLAAYPAGFLGGISIQKDLYISSTVTKIMELFTFGSGTLDVFSIGGSVVAQQGSSGGAVVNEEGRLLGIIVTSSVAESTQDRDLRAIAIGHINRSFVKDTGFDLQTLFSGDIIAEADAFGENIAPELTQLLVDELEK